MNKKLSPLRIGAWNEAARGAWYGDSVCMCKINMAEVEAKVSKQHLLLSYFYFRASGKVKHICFTNYRRQCNWLWLHLLMCCLLTSTSTSAILILYPKGKSLFHDPLRVLFQAPMFGVDIFVVHSKAFFTGLLSRTKEHFELPKINSEIKFIDNFILQKYQ